MRAATVTVIYITVGRMPNISCEIVARSLKKQDNILVPVQTS